MENITQEQEEQAALAVNPKKSRKKMGNIWQLHLMMVVPVVFLVVFSYIPLAGIRIAFVKDYNPTLGIWGSEWGGWYWFEFMFKDPRFLPILWNTLKIAVMKIVIGFPIPIIFALLLNEMRSVGTKKTVQTIVYLPSLLSWVIVGGILFRMFSTTGSINSMLTRFGYEPKEFLTNGNSFIAIIVISDIWKNFGYSAIIFLAAIAGLDSTLYEAAEIDGANRWKQTVHITIPGIMQVVMLIGILNLGGILNAGFEQILILYNPMVKDVAEIIDTFVYEQGLKLFNTQFATAVGLFKSVIGMVLVVGANYLAYKFTDYRII